MRMWIAHPGQGTGITKAFDDGLIWVSLVALVSSWGLESPGRSLWKNSC